jgi:hypothetical protein
MHENPIANRRSAISGSSTFRKILIASRRSAILGGLLV